MIKALKIPKEQRSFAARGAQSVEDAAASGRYEPLSGKPAGGLVQTSMNLDEMGRYGNLKQNTTSQLKIQDR